MASIEKVIKGFEQCWEKEPNTRNCNECPYLEYRDQGHGKSCADRMHLDALELLKEQKAVEPTWSLGKPFCGACGLRIHGGKFCSECGKPILWENMKS